MKRILIAYDGTAGAEAALRDLALAGLPEHAEGKILTIADVWLPPDAELAEPQFPDRIPVSRVTARQHAMDALKEARRISEAGAGQLRQQFPGWTVHQAARADSPAWAILAEARRWPADLVVVGSHGRSPFEKFFLGSVSYKVAAEGSCSVRIYRPQKNADHAKIRLLVAVDGSDDSKAAVQEVLGRAWPAGTEFDLATIIDPKLKSGPFSEEKFARVEDWVEPMLAELAGQLSAKGFTTNTHVLEGDFKGTLLKHAEMWKVDCIFLGARGLDHRNRLYLGTSASAIATRAHCTVEIVRTQVPAAAEA